MFVFSDRVLEHPPHGRRYPKYFGLFGHSATVRKKNTLLISGGYHGSVSSDVLAYIFPYALAMTENDKVTNNSCLIVPRTAGFILIEMFCCTSFLSRLLL